MTIQIHRVGELEYLTFGDKTDPGVWGCGSTKRLVTIQTQGVGKWENLTFGDNTDPGGWGSGSTHSYFGWANAVQALKTITPFFRPVKSNFLCTPFQTR